MEGTKVAPQMLSFLPKSMKPGKVFIISDIDILWDENYVDTRFSEQNTTYGAISWANNGDFIERIINLSSNDMPLLGLSAKQIFPEAGLEYKFQQESQKHFAPRISELEQELQKYQKQLDFFNSQDKSLGDMQQQNQIANKITQTEQQIKQLNYQIDKMKNTKERNFVILNIITTIIFLAALAIMFRIQLKKRKFISSGEE